MKIWYQSNSTYRFDPASDGYGRNLEAQCKRAARLGTEVFVTGVKTHGQDIDIYKSIMYWHTNQLINNVMRAEKEGFDAFVIGCSFDVGMDIGREITSMPVIGIAQANLHVAAMMGELFTVVTCMPRLAERYRQLIRAYGLQQKYLSNNYIYEISEWDLAAKLKAGDEEELSSLSDTFRRLAEKAVSEGASVIVPVPAHISQLFLQTGGLTNLNGATVLDPVAVAVKVAEFMVDLKTLGMDISRVPQVYPLVPKELLKKTLDLYSPVFRIGQ